MRKYVHSKLDSKDKKQSIDEIQINGHTSNNNWQVANYFNEFFSTVVLNLNINSVPPSNHMEIPQFLLNPTLFF